MVVMTMMMTVVADTVVSKVVAADIAAAGIAVGTAVQETRQGSVSLDCTCRGRVVVVNGSRPTDVQPSTVVRSSPTTVDAPSGPVRT